MAGPRSETAASRMPLSTCMLEHLLWDWFVGKVTDQRRRLRIVGESYGSKAQALGPFVNSVRTELSHSRRIAARASAGEGRGSRWKRRQT
jgi:hypothetical protein